MKEEEEEEEEEEEMREAGVEWQASSHAYSTVQGSKSDQSTPGMTVRDALPGQDRGLKGVLCPQETHTGHAITHRR